MRATRPSSGRKCRAPPSGTGRCSATRSARRSSPTTPSSSSPTWRASRPAHGARSSSPRARTRRRWGSPSRSTSRNSRERAGASCTPRSRGAWLRADRLREDPAPGDDHAQPARGPERLRLPDAARARARLLGRLHQGRRPHRGRARVLRRRRPQVLERGVPGQAGRVLEVVRRLQGRARPPARDRQADSRADQRDLRGRGQRAPDGVRPGRHGGRRVHPPRGARARLGAGRRRDPVADDHGRRSPRTRDRPPLRGDPGGEGGRVGPREPRRAGGGARRGGRPARREPRAQAPADDSLRKAAPQLLARPRLAPDDQPRTRLARPLDGDGGAAGGRPQVPGEELSLVLVEREEPIAVVLLNRPDVMNALNDEVMDELARVLGELDDDEAVGCLVLGGSERAFAAGADIGEMAEADAMDMYDARRIDRWDALRKLRTPLVAAVSGYCLGGGCELAMACDLIVASESSRFGQPETGLGIIPGAGGTQRLTRAVGKAKAMDVILSGRFLDAHEAERAGLVARVVAREAWLDEAKRVAREIASKGPVAQRLAKEAVNRAFDTTLNSGLDVERKLFHLAHSTEDAAEGLRAFGEKRRPDFKGR